jgi:hypothetical protein
MGDGGWVRFFVLHILFLVRARPVTGSRSLFPPGGAWSRDGREVAAKRAAAHGATIPDWARNKTGRCRFKLEFRSQEIEFLPQSHRDTEIFWQPRIEHGFHDFTAETRRVFLTELSKLKAKATEF